MQSRRDQVQAQSYVLGRLTSALVGADPDGLENPNRRMVTGTISGVLIAALMFGGFAVFGFVVPGGASTWRQPGVVVVEKETGSRYIYVGGLLRPVLNYSSARLLFGKAPKMVTVSGKSLRGVAHGQPVGIVGAPDALPTGNTVGGQVWTVCAIAVRDRSGAQSVGTSLAIDLADTAARHDTPLSPDQAVVVTDGDDTFLVWRGRRLRLAETWLARVLGYEDAPVTVGTNWLESVPVGPDIAPPAVPGRGTAGPDIDGRRTTIGELFTAQTAGTPERRYLLMKDGLAELSPVAYAIVAADPATAEAYHGRPVAPHELSPAALVQLPVSRRPALPDGLPDIPPRPAPTPAGGSWCVRQSMADGGVEVTADTRGPAATAVQDGAGLTRTDRTAAAVTVQPGVGGLVLAGRMDQAAGSGFYLVTDAGIKYPLGSAAVAGVLGFPSTRAHPVPRELLEMLPTGPLLDTASATE
nr:type VII secretion protein EccB [uncultured Actinoplanes sp.]